ncbi:MAG: TetR/AcrR family transcriptional regulator [Lewinella sp.]
MPITKTTPEAILRSSWAIFHRHGYHDTSLQQLAEAAGLGKAGLLHHFKSKAGLMHAVIEYALDWYRRKILAVAKEDGSVAMRLEIVLRRHFELVQYNDGGGCFFANMTLETGVDGAFSEGLQKFHTEWCAAIEGLLSERFPPEEAKERAYRIYVEYQGSVMLYKLYRDPSHLQRFTYRILRSLDLPITPDKPTK